LERPCPLVHTNGFGARLCTSMYSRMAASNSFTAEQGMRFC
jgi:hypothetical protein